MKKIITLSIICLLATACFAQVPDLMNYQAVARNNAGAALANQNIRVRLSILRNAVLQYSETRQVTTNALGLFNVQIGSAGALATSGSFSGINWQNNAAPGYVLRVELDVNNSGTFTDMGSQALVTVPYAFAAKRADEATEAVNINGRPVDRVNVPATGSRLMYDGSKWISVKKDTVISVAGSILVVQSTPAGPIPWVFLAGSSGATDLPVITVTGNETVVANFTASLGNPSANPVMVSASICYQNISTGVITSFYETPAEFVDLSILPNSLKTQISATGAIRLPAGTYRIGMGVKNKSTSVNLSPNDYYNGVIEIKY